MAIDDKFLEKLKSANDIVDVIGSYCNLEQKGGSYWACCPLPGHMEKTPSFSVNSSGQFYHCFGCGRGGDVIKFIQEIESLEFMDAVKFLAERANIEMPEQSHYDDEKIKKDRQKKDVCLSILKDTALFYVNNLNTEKGSVYVDYLQKRGIDRKLQIAFGLGASLDYDTLPKYLAQKGYAYQDMLDAGVVSFDSERNRYSDFLGKRLIIPIINALKAVIAFGGRVLEKTDFAKYKNTSETFLFQKKHTLYNINRIRSLKAEGGKLDHVIMVEGYMDTIALATAGINNVVASMGTSLTKEQAKLISRYTDTVIISYDGDAAGQNATMRGMDILRDVGLTVKVIALPDGLDPDEVVRQRGVDAYISLVNNSKLLSDYKLFALQKKFNVSTAQGKRDFVDSAIKVIAQVDKSFEQEELLKELSQLSGIAYEYLRRDLDKTPQKQPVDIDKPVVEKSENTALKGLVTAERYVLYSLLDKKPFAKTCDLDDLEFTSAVREQVANLILDKADEGQNLQPSMVADYVGFEHTEELNRFLPGAEEFCQVANAEKYYFDCIKVIKIYKIDRDIEELNKRQREEVLVENQLQFAALIDKKRKEKAKLQKTEDKK